MTDGEKTKLSKIFLESWHPFFWIAMLIFLVYSATLFSKIVYLDDNVFVTGQYQFNRHLSNIPQTFNEDIFRTPYNGGTFYRPILRLTFMLDAQFGERGVVFMSHFTNILLHILAICLLFKFLLAIDIKKETAFLFALIFGIHPLTAQTAAFIPGRNDSLLAVFIFLSLIFFINFLQTQKNKHLLWHLSFFALALFTKETAIALPAICAIYFLIFIKNFELRNTSRPMSAKAAATPKRSEAECGRCERGVFPAPAFAPLASVATAFSLSARFVIQSKKYKIYLKLGLSWIGIGIFWFLIRRSVLHNFIGNASYNFLLSIFKNLPSLIPAIGKIFLPFNLSVFPVMNDMTIAYGSISLILLAIWFCFCKKKNLKLIAFGFLWFFIFILLTLVKPVNTVPEFSENRIYLPMFGFIFVILGLGVIRLPAVIEKKINYEISQKKIILLASILIILIFSSITFYRNNYYKDKINFWKNAAETSPSFAFNYNNLGAMYYLDGKYDLAEECYKKSLAINNFEPMVHNNLGLIYTNKGLFKDAEQEYLEELSFNPYYDNAHFNLGILYYKIGKLEEAKKEWKKTLEINPEHGGARHLIDVLNGGKMGL
ncbi:MAG: tetratricopeptide repeat protein [bacterium]